MLSHIFLCQLLDSDAFSTHPLFKVGLWIRPAQGGRHLWLCGKTRQATGGDNLFYCQFFYRFWFSIVKFGKIRYMFSLVWPASTWKLVRSTRSRWSWLQRRCFFLFLFCISRRWELAADISEFPICRTTPLVRCQSSSGSNSRRTTLLLTPEPKGLSRFGKLMDHWSTDWRG